MGSERKIHIKRKNKNVHNSSPDYSHIDWEQVQKLFDHDIQPVINKLRKSSDDSTHTKDILKLLAAGAVIGISCVVPTFPLIISAFIPKDEHVGIRRMKQTVTQLARQKYVEKFEKDGQQYVRITNKGRLRVLHYKLQAMNILKPKTWDKKWRVIIFDVPEQSKRYREIFRMHLKKLGFYLLQDSVWVHPFECFDEIDFLKGIYHIDIHVTCMLVEKIENDESLLHHFYLT